MEAEFSEQGVTLILDPREYSFVFRCLNDRLTTLADWEIAARLGWEVARADEFVDSLLAAESVAREQGHHWTPARESHT